jgi:hypothetical protein
LYRDVGLAERIERVETQMIAAASEAGRRRRSDGERFVIPLAGGIASFAEPGSPFNKVAGLGFGGVPDEAALDEIERAYADLGCPVQIELAHLVDPAIGSLLTARGYRLESFENVLGRSLTDGFEQATPPGIELRPSGDDELESWLAVVVDGFAHPDDQGVPSHEEFPREILRHAVRDMGGRGEAVRGPEGRCSRRWCQLPHLRGRRAARGCRDRARPPPPGRSECVALGPTRGGNRRRLRRRCDHHPAGIEIPAERATVGLRPPLHARRAHQAPLRTATRREGRQS